MLSLIPLAGPQKGQAIPMPVGALVGRGLECQLRLPHASVSRVHARVEVRDGTWYAVDQGSRNGIHLDGQRFVEVRLAQGQRLKFGDFPVRVDLGAPEAGAESAAGPAEPEEEELVFVDELEGLELLSTQVAPRSRAAAETPAPVEAGGLELEDPAQIELERPVRPAPPPSAAALAKERQADFLRAEARERSGLWRGDFEQLSFGQQALLFTVALLVLGGIAWLVAFLISGSR